MLDDPCVDRQPVGPLFVAQHIGEPRDAATPGFHLCAPHLDKTGAHRVKCGHDSFNPGPSSGRPSRSMVVQLDAQRL